MKHLKYYMSMIAGLLAMLTACTNDMVENGPSELWEKQGNEYTITTYVGIPSYEENQNGATEHLRQENPRPAARVDNDRQTRAVTFDQKACLLTA